MSTIDRAAFERSDYNTLINNVSASLVSNVYQKINPYQVGVLEPVEMHDDLQTDPKYTRVRYQGSKVESAKYNVYTTASSFQVGLQSIEWPGDTSYGKTAAIDYTVGKFAFANSINSTNLNFYDKTTINIKYLIDITGSITELSANNRNLFEVQNMYKKGDIAYISLFDRYNPTNQATLDGPKVIFEGGIRYSPLMFRDVGENIVFTYIVPDQSVDNRFGLKAVNTTSSLWQTTGNTNAEFSSNSGIGYTFVLNGLYDANIKAMSFTKSPSVNWPYSYMPLTSYTQGNYKDYQNVYRKIGAHDTTDDVPSFYSIEWFLPLDTSTLEGGYASTNGGGDINEVKGSISNYTYYLAPRNSTYVVNVDIPIKVKGRNPETPGERGQEKGPSIVKIIGVLEVQKSGNASWDYLDFSDPSSPKPYGYTVFNATNIPVANGGREATGTTRAMVDEENSFLYFSADTIAGTYSGRYISPYFEGRCQLFNKEVRLGQNDKIRVRLFFAEVTTFFRRNEDIYFEIERGDSSKNYFEVYDATNSDVSIITTKTLSGNAIFSTDPDNKMIIFNNDMSLLYKNSIFEPQDLSNPNSTANLYSPIELPFTFQVNDIVRFTRFYSISPEYYSIQEVIDPIIQIVGTEKTVLSPLKIILNRSFNPNLIDPNTFAFFRKVPDETVIMLNFKKRNGLASNALILPHNLEGTINKNLGEIIGPLKDTVLSKVLVIA